jgi:hypothetical protein
MPILNEVVSTDATAGVETPAGTSDFASIRERIFGNKKPSSPKVKKATVKDEALATETEALEKIFAGENWEEVASLYFNARFAITGWDGFELTNPQKKTLGISLATTMKMLLHIDPGYIALIVFTANFGGLIAQKEMTYRSLVNAEEKKRGTGHKAD